MEAMKQRRRETQIFEKNAKELDTSISPHSA